MTTPFFCTNKDRWKKVSESDSVNGIDYLEVSSVDQKTLKLFFLHNLPGETDGIPANPPLTKENIFIEGGVRVKSIIVLAVKVENKNVLKITVDKAGDFSTYRLKIGTSLTSPDIPPAGFDIQLSSVDFTFKVNCPAEFDCKQDVVCPPELPAEPDIDYLAKDYSSFKRLMLDRLSVIMPDWKERNAADLQIALVELMAYMGDHLSYYQDAVATEAYLDKARRRVSLKRHARLLDYNVHDGCNARVWVHFDAEESGPAENQTIGVGTTLMTNGDDGEYTIHESEKDNFITVKDPVVFETLHSITLHSSHNRILFYTWTDSACCLPKGSTKATLKDDPALALAPGDVLIFEELYSPSTGKKADRDLAHRHAVRIKNIERGIIDQLTGIPVMNIEWYDSDALPFSMNISSDVENEDDELDDLYAKCVAMGNNVLADHGMSKEGQTLYPESHSGDEKYYPRLPEKNITVMESFDNELGKYLSASDSIVQNPHKALPKIILAEEGGDSWTGRQDLLGSDKFATEFVVETDQEGTSFIRFGDDTLGKQPLDGFTPKAYFRIGNGKEGNIGPESVNTLVWDIGGITGVRNPMTASGGENPETMEEIRQFAPQAFRTQERAVTESDYVAKAELHEEVQKAAAKFYWTGSWYTVYIIIDRKNGIEVDDSFKDEIVNHLEQYRLAGYDLEVRGPVFVPLSIVLNVCVKPGYFSSYVNQSLQDAFSNYERSDGTRGYFHPDNFTFGQAVYLSSIYKTAMDVQGVASVEIKEFKRWAKNASSEIADGKLQPAELEIIRLDNDPSLPENGKISFITSGGL